MTHTHHHGSDPLCTSSQVHKTVEEHLQHVLYYHAHFFIHKALGRKEGGRERRGREGEGGEGRGEEGGGKEEVEMERQNGKTRREMDSHRLLVMQEDENGTKGVQTLLQQVISAPNVILKVPQNGGQDHHAGFLGVGKDKEEEGPS